MADKDINEQEEKTFAFDVPNETTAAAIREGKEMMLDPSAPRYSSLEALREALEE